MCASPQLRASVSIQRHDLVRALTFLKRAKTRADRVMLSFDGDSILVDCGRTKAEIPATGQWEGLTVVRRDQIMSLLRVAKLLPCTIEMAAGDGHLHVHTWSFEVECAACSPKANGRRRVPPSLPSDSLRNRA